jgi:hypothetical protein
MSMFLLRWKLLHTCLLELKFSFQLFLLNLSDSHMRWIVGCMCMDMVCAHECHGTVLLIFFLHVRCGCILLKAQDNHPIQSVTGRVQTVDGPCLQGYSHKRMPIILLISLVVMSTVQIWLWIWPVATLHFLCSLMPCESAVEWNVALDGNLDLLTLLWYWRALGLWKFG